MDRLLRGPTVVRSGRNPHSVSLALGLTAISLYGLFFEPASVSIDAGLDGAQRLAFSILTVLGALITIAGIFWPTLLVGLLVERIGQLLLSTGAAVYVVVLCSVSTFERSGLITTIGCAIAVGSMWRVVQITRDLKPVRTWMETHQ